MDNTKKDSYYIKKIIIDLDFILIHTNGVSKEALESNDLWVDSMMFRLIQISENTKLISADFKTKNSQIPWKSIVGLRNKIVHEYGSVNLSIIFNTIYNDIPHLRELLKTLAV
ncbi:MAG: DUF86 domain-containing protein [Bacilli bacterium]|nr:DUF86 domain-containing protein [Bacilli bacterium]MDD4066176.1 DUF86 domain-containing protein [Bacilli bacterium]